VTAPAMVSARPEVRRRLLRHLQLLSQAPSRSGERPGYLRGCRDRDDDRAGSL